MDPVTLSVIGGLIGGGGQILKGISDRNTAQAEANSRFDQAMEVDFMSGQLEQVAREQGRALLGNQASAYAHAGVGSISGSALRNMTETSAKIERQISNQKRADAFQAEKLREGADSLYAQSQASFWGGLLTGVGTFGLGVAKSESIKDKNNGSTIKLFGQSEHNQQTQNNQSLMYTG